MKFAEVYGSISIFWVFEHTKMEALVPSYLIANIRVLGLDASSSCRVHPSESKKNKEYD
jgi:hypothetical protein